MGERFRTRIIELSALTSTLDGFLLLSFYDRYLIEPSTDLRFLLVFLTGSFMFFILAAITSALAVASTKEEPPFKSLLRIARRLDDASIMLLGAGFLWLYMFPCCILSELFGWFVLAVVAAPVAFLWFWWLLRYFRADREKIEVKYE